MAMLAAAAPALNCSSSSSAQHKLALGLGVTSSEFLPHLSSLINYVDLALNFSRKVYLLVYLCEHLQLICKRVIFASFLQQFLMSALLNH